MAREWRMKSFPGGLPTAENFALIETKLPPLADGQIRVRNGWLSIDPAVRWRMQRSTSIVPLRPGDAIEAPAIGEVVETRSPRFAVGDKISHRQGWRDEAVVDDREALHLPAIDVAPEAFLGQLGLPGLTAYVGLIDIAGTKAGDVVFISAAAGAVGLAAIQIAKNCGAIVVGSAGGAEKCALVKKFGADAVIDYKSPGSLEAKLMAAAPGGIDVYFDNVGAGHLDAALLAARNKARFAICGMISEYNEGQPSSYANLRRLISANITMRGFRVGEHTHRLADFHRDAALWISSGRFATLETVRFGLEEVPAAFRELFIGSNRGKMVVKI
jgi:NADPH-dependent curcumin reductase CurA